MIKASNIGYRLKKKWLLQNIDGAFTGNRMHVIAGPNGAGKSTLLRILSGEIYPSRGSVEYDNTTINSIPAAELARFRAKLSQHTEVGFPMKVKDLVMMGRLPHFTHQPSKTDHAFCRDALELFELEPFADREFHTLSGGEQQRVHFARTIAQLLPLTPSTQKFLFLDEPLTFLDIRNQHDLLNKTKLLMRNGNLTVVAVLHDINLAASFADTAMLLKHGQVHSFGELQETMTEKNIGSVFDIPCTMAEISGKRQFIFG